MTVLIHRHTLNKTPGAVVTPDSSGNYPDWEQNRFDIYGSTDGYPVRIASFAYIPSTGTTWLSQAMKLRWNKSLGGCSLYNVRATFTSVDNGALLLSGACTAIRKGGVTTYCTSTYDFGTIAPNGTLEFEIGIRPSAALVAAGSVRRMVEMTFSDGPVPVLYGSKELLPCPYGGRSGALDYYRQGWKLLIRASVAVDEVVLTESSLGGSWSGSSGGSDVIS